jgi:predicted MFS family arabinose efflux permease
MTSVIGLLTLSAATFVAITTEMLPVGLLPQMSRATGASEATLGLLVTVYALTVVVLALPMTVGTRRLPRKGLLISTVLAYTAGNLLVAVAPGLVLLFTGRVVAGAAHALFFALVSAYAGRLVPSHLVGRAIAVTFAGTSLGYVFGVPLATSVGDAVGWRVAFAALAAGAGLLALVMTTLLPRTDRAPASGGPSRAHWRSGLVAVGAVNIVLFLGQYVFYTYVSPYLIDRGLAESSVGSVLLLFGAAGLIGLWLAGLVIDRRPRAGLLAAIAIMAVSVAVLALPLDVLAVTLVAGSTWSLGFGAIPSFLITAAVRTASVSPDVAGAVVNATSNLGIATGAAAGGLVLVHAGLDLLPVMAVVLLLAGLAVVAVSRQGFPTTAEPAGTPT